jgi:hypothetical protein
MAAGALALAGCGIADSRSPVPQFMRGKPVDPRDAVFVAASYPRQVRVSPPHHVPNGPGWIACVRANVNSATGRPIGVQTYRITISGGIIVDRLRVEDDDNCASESYEPI